MASSGPAQGYYLFYVFASGVGGLAAIRLLASLPFRHVAVASTRFYSPFPGARHAAGALALVARRLLVSRGWFPHDPPRRGQGWRIPAWGVACPLQYCIGR